MRRALAIVTLLCACGGESQPPADRHDRADTLEPAVVDLPAAVDEAGYARIDLELEVSGSRQLLVELGGQARIVELAVDGAWQRPQLHDEDLALTLEGERVSKVTVWAWGGRLPAVDRDRSLVWTDAALLDGMGLGPLLAAASDDGHGGVLFDRWFRRFASTAHSERAGPAQLVADMEGDPASWDLQALPFKVTAVHNRLDLAPRAGDCGELRVSLSSIHPIYQPLHLIFLFGQPVVEGDTAPDGTVHCLETARRWTRLSALSDAAFIDAARTWLASGLVHEHFLLAESVELTVSPWEWRQWTPTGEPDALDNPRLFQTVDTPRLNQPGDDRDAFLAFVDDNAEGLLARDVLIPERFRARSATAPPSIPLEPLDLEGRDPALGEAIEIVGCPKCHTDNADFVHTLTDRSFSDFYDRELDARALRLERMNDSAEVVVPPFGPLQ